LQEKIIPKYRLIEIYVSGKNGQSDMPYAFIIPDFSSTKPVLFAIKLSLFAYNYIGDIMNCSFLSKVTFTPQTEARCRTMSTLTPGYSSVALPQQEMLTSLNTAWV
jgi:hypothetical protein